MKCISVSQFGHSKLNLIFQHYLTMIGAIVSIPFIFTPALCMEDEDPSRGRIISTMIFVTGIVTYIQATWGCRLPIVQVHFTFTLILIHNIFYFEQLEM